jgi:hypothetical protein
MDIRCCANVALQAGALYCSAVGCHDVYVSFYHGDQLTQAKVGKHTEFPLFYSFGVVLPTTLLFRLVLLRNH